MAKLLHNWFLWKVLFFCFQTIKTIYYQTNSFIGETNFENVFKRCPIRFYIIHEGGNTSSLKLVKITRRVCAGRQIRNKQDKINSNKWDEFQECKKNTQITHIHCILHVSRIFRKFIWKAFILLSDFWANYIVETRFNANEELN